MPKRVEVLLITYAQSYNTYNTIMCSPIVLSSLQLEAWLTSISLR